MQSKFFKINKKGDVSIFWEFISIVAAVLLVTALFVGLINKLSAIGSQKDDGSIANFNRLYSNIQKLMENSKSKACIEDNYFLSKKYKHRLVGFDTKWDDKKGVISGTLSNYNVYKPFICGNSACICLYMPNWKPEDSAKRDQGIVDCRSDIFAGKGFIFLGEINVEPKTRGVKRDDIGQYLALFGEDWGLQPIYIEKEYKKEENKYYIYISKINNDKEDDSANIRKKQIGSCEKISKP